MKEELMQQLKIAANQFYLGKYLDLPRLDDSTYDKLVAEYESEAEGRSVKDLVEWDSEMRMINESMNSLSKIQVQDNDLAKACSDYLKQKHGILMYYLNYKYDGSSIKAYYDEDGRLTKILGTPDEHLGIVRTKAFWNMFPHKLPKEWNVCSLQGEVLVDANVYGKLARNKANGLTNSKYMDDQIENEAFIVIYGVRFHGENPYDYVNQINVLQLLKSIVKTRVRKLSADGTPMATVDTVFFTAKSFDVDEENGIPETDIIQYYIEGYGPAFQVDGVVGYFPDEIKGFKFYYTEYADVIIKDIIWQRKDNGSYSAVLQFDPVTLNDKSIQFASSNGVPTLVGSKLGVGAKARVILANMTIPKVIKTLEPSEDYKFPVCECGYQMSEKDIFGSVLKCSNHDVCCTKVGLVTGMITRRIDWWRAQDSSRTDASIREWFNSDYAYVPYLMSIDRWNPDRMKLIELDEQFKSKIEDLIKTEDSKGFRDLMLASFRYTGMQYQMLDINIVSAFNALLTIKDEL